MSLHAAISAILLLAPAGRLPIQLAGNTTFVQVRVNGSGPYDFILDTGALGSSLAPHLVEELKLPTGGDGFARGAGGSVEAIGVPGVTLEVGGVRLADLALRSFAMTEIENSVGRRIDGVLGAELFQRYVVEIDYLAAQITLHDRESFSPRGRGKGLPLSFYDNHPYVRAAVTLPGGREIEGEFVIDSGSNFPLILLPSFIEDHGLRATLPPTIATVGRGVGGEVPLPIGRTAKLRLGEITIERPVTAFPASGYFARSGKAGNIGGAVLRRFRVTFDYAHRRVYLQPNERFDLPYDYDMSGLALVSEGPAFGVRRVQRVLPASPAQEAGLAAGDELVSIDGRKASDVPLAELREILRQPERDIPIEARRGDSTLSVVLRTRRLV